jgi:Amt family ammonium transporter
MSQIIGSGATTVATLVVAFVLMYAVKATGTLRVSREGEIEGLDIHEHGMFAYPEFATHPSEALHGPGKAAEAMHATGVLHAPKKANV